MQEIKQETIEELKKVLLDSIGNSHEEAVRELARYRKEFPNELDFNVYAYGNVLPYYSQIRTFFEEQGETPPEDSQALEVLFKVCVRRAVRSILREAGL